MYTLHSNVNTSINAHNTITHMYLRVYGLVRNLCTYNVEATLYTQTTQVNDKSNLVYTKVKR